MARRCPLRLHSRRRDTDGCRWFFDQVNYRFRKVTGQKINDKLFRVDFRIQNEDDKYYLPAKLDPSKKGSVRPLQRYIDALVEEGRELMNQAKLTKPERKAASLKREADKEWVTVRNQLGGGTNPGQWEHTSTLPDQSYKPAQGAALQEEYGKLSATENKFTYLDEAKATKGLDQYQLWKMEQDRGNEAFERLMLFTRGEGMRNTSHPPAEPCEPRQTKPLVVPEPAAQPPHQALTVGHEALRVSLLALLACMVQGRPTVHIQGSRL